MTPVFTVTKNGINVHGEAMPISPMPRVRNPLYVGSIRGYGSGRIASFSRPLKKFFVKTFSIEDVGQRMTRDGSINIISIIRYRPSSDPDGTGEILDTHEITDHMSEDKLLSRWYDEHERCKEKFHDEKTIIAIEQHAIMNYKSKEENKNDC